MFTLYPHQTRYVVPARAVHVLPDDVPPARAVLAANLETAINGVWDARPHVGDRITVDRRRHRRLPRGVARRTDRRVRRRAGRRQPAARGDRARARRRASRAAVGARRGAIWSFTPADRRPGLALALSIAGVRGDDRRDELVRRSGGAGRARRGVPCAAADAQIVAGRQRRRVAARALGHRATDAAGAVDARGSGARRADHRRERLRRPAAT